MRKIFSIIIATLLFVVPVCAAEINVVTSGAFTAAYMELVPLYERETHNKVVTGFGPSMGTTINAIPVRLNRGESIDVVIMASPALDQLIKEGKVHKESRVELVRSLIGMAVKAGVPKPDISTVEAFKQSLLAAKSIAYPDPAAGHASGIHFRGVLERLGIADQVNAKAKLQKGTFAGSPPEDHGEIGITQPMEILATPGFELAGWLPPEGLPRCEGWAISGRCRPCFSLSLSTSSGSVSSSRCCRFTRCASPPRRRR